jgi:RNA polymerase sigma factor (sigma-70 family)
MPKTAPPSPVTSSLHMRLLARLRRHRRPRGLDAEDLVQDTYCELLKTHPNQEIPETHVYVTARNILIGAIRHATRQKRDENQLDPTPVEELDESLDADSIYTLLDPEVEEQLLRSRLTRIAPTLNEIEHEIIIMTALGHSDQEIEEKLGLKPGRAKIARFRVKGKLLHLSDHADQDDKNTEA